jgi:hypothetical protein
MDDNQRPAIRHISAALMRPYVSKKGVEELRGRWGRATVIVRGLEKPTQEGHTHELLLATTDFARESV